MKSPAASRDAQAKVGTMNETKRKFGLKHGLALVVALAIVVGLAIAYVIASGLADSGRAPT